MALKVRRGYTLIELLIVILVISLITMLAVTRMDFLVPKYKLRAGAREFGVILKQARSRASSSGRDIYVRIHLSEDRYELLVPFEKPNPSADLYPADTPPEDLPPKEYEYQELLQKNLPKDVHFTNVILGLEPDQTITSGTVTIRVTPYGLGNHLLANLRLDERRMAIKLNGLTGNVWFYEEERQADDFLEDAPE